MLILSVLENIKRGLKWLLVVDKSHSIQVLHQRIRVGGLRRNADTELWRGEKVCVQQKSKENDTNNHDTDIILPESWTNSITDRPYASKNFP